MDELAPHSSGQPTSGRLRRLLREAIDRDRAATNPNTRRVYEDGWRQFEAFCDREGLRPMPAAPETVVAFMEHLAAEGYHYNTIKMRLAALSIVHQEAGAANPYEDRLVRRQRRNLRRTLDITPDSKKPLLLEHLEKILEVIDDTSLGGVRDRALLLVGFAGAFRRSELVGIDVGDIRDVTGGKVIAVKQSKTDPGGQGLVKQIPHGTRFYSPNKALDLWLEAGEIYQGPVFRMVDRWENVRGGRLTGQSVLDIVKKYMGLIGEDPDDYGAHSLRAGLLTQGYLDGVGEHELAAVSNHQSLDILRDYQRVSIVMEDHPLKKMGEDPSN